MGQSSLVLGASPADLAGLRLEDPLLCSDAIASSTLLACNYLDRIISYTSQETDIATNRPSHEMLSLHRPAEALRGFLGPSLCDAAGGRGG